MASGCTREIQEWEPSSYPHDGGGVQALAPGQCTDWQEIGQNADGLAEPVHFRRASFAADSSRICSGSTLFAKGLFFVDRAALGTFGDARRRYRWRRLIEPSDAGRRLLSRQKRQGGPIDIE